MYKCVCTCVHTHHNRPMEAVFVTVLLLWRDTMTKVNFKKKTFNLEFVVAEGNRVHDHKVKSTQEQHGSNRELSDLIYRHRAERLELVWDSELSNCILKAVLPPIGPHLLSIPNSSHPNIWVLVWPFSFKPHRDKKTTCRMIPSFYHKFPLSVLVKISFIYWVILPALIFFLLK